MPSGQWIRAQVEMYLPHPKAPELELVQEGIMSQRNGDKARFGRQHYRKTLLRKQMRDLRKALTGKVPALTMIAAK